MGESRPRPRTCLHPGTEVIRTRTAVVLLHGSQVLALKGAKINTVLWDLLPLLDGDHYPSELAARVGAPEQVVEDLLRLMHRRGMLKASYTQGSIEVESEKAAVMIFGPPEWAAWLRNALTGEGCVADPGHQLGLETSHYGSLRLGEEPLGVLLTGPNLTLKRLCGNRVPLQSCLRVEICSRGLTVGPLLSQSRHPRIECLGVYNDDEGGAGMRAEGHVERWLDQAAREVLHLVRDAMHDYTRCTIRTFGPAWEYGVSELPLEDCSACSGIGGGRVGQPSG